jgi:hypothetical protein
MIGTGSLVLSAKGRGIVAEKTTNEHDRQEGDHGN